MRTRIGFLFVAVLFAVFTLTVHPRAKADNFGSGTNAFTIDFVSIGNVGNAANASSLTFINNANVGNQTDADGDGYGSVAYEYRISTYEIPQDAITRAIAGGLANVTVGTGSGNQPAININWYEAAAFVNWLNTSSGYQEAYNLAWDGAAWSMELWSTDEAWQEGGLKLYRHKNSHYFLPSEDEWHKAAYYSPAGTNYFLYPTGSDTAPTAVTGGTADGTAVIMSAASSIFPEGPAAVTNAGGLSPYGTMAQGGNVAEWMETPLDPAIISPTSAEPRIIFGGYWGMPNPNLLPSSGGIMDPLTEGTDIGFRVASVPEPSTYALLLMTGAGALRWARRRR